MQSSIRDKVVTGLQEIAYDLHALGNSYVEKVAEQADPEPVIDLAQLREVARCSKS